MPCRSTATPRPRSPPRRTCWSSTWTSSGPRRRRWRAAACWPAGTRRRGGMRIWTSTQTSTGVRAAVAAKLGLAAGRRGRDHPRRRRRLRGQDHAPVAGRGAGAVGGAAARAAGQVHRGPARALHRQRARARAAAPRPGRVRRRGPDPRAGRAVLARQRRLHPLRPDRADHHLDPAARPVQAGRLPGRVRLALHQHRDRHPVPGRGPPAGRVRHGTHHGRDRGRSSGSTGRWCASATSSSPTRCPTTRG